MNEIPSNTQMVLALLDSYPLAPISEDFGVIELELTEETLVPLLKVAEYIWDMKGTQIILENQVWSNKKFPLDGIRFKISALFYRILLAQRKIADLSRILNCLKEALADPAFLQNQENLAILLCAMGAIYMLKAKANYVSRQFKAVKPLAANAVKALQVAMNMWGDDKFQMTCQSQISAAYTYLGKRALALKTFEAVQQLNAELGIDLEAELQKAGWDSTKIKGFLGK